MVKTIIISEENHKKLLLMKIEKNGKTLNQIISNLIKENDNKEM